MALTDVVWQSDGHRVTASCKKAVDAGFERTAKTKNQASRTARKKEWKLRSVRSACAHAMPEQRAGKALQSLLIIDGEKKSKPHPIVDVIYSRHWTAFEGEQSGSIGNMNFAVTMQTQ